MNAALIKSILEETMQIDGALGACLVDYKSGMCLGTLGGGTMNLEIAGAGSADFVKAKMKTMTAIGMREGIEDILVTMGSQYHLIRIVEGDNNLFIWLALNRANSNLAMARHMLTATEKKMAA